MLRTGDSKRTARQSGGKKDIRHRHTTFLHTSSSTKECFQNRSLLLPERTVALDDDQLFENEEKNPNSQLNRITSATKDSVPVLCSVSESKVALS